MRVLYINNILEGSAYIQHTLWQLAQRHRYTLVNILAHDE